MARVLLVIPSAHEPVNTPLLSVAYLAASLQRAGHTPLVVDAAAPAGPRDPEAVFERASAFEPDLVGLHLKTVSVRSAYRLAARLQGLAAYLVAGGPHASAVPGEALEHGFDAVCLGEADSTLVELAHGIDEHRCLTNVAGAMLPGQAHSARPAAEALDDLPSPFDALPLFDASWYPMASRPTFGGLVSSRGCPCCCTFCHSGVVGQGWRHHGTDRVLREVRSLENLCGQTTFHFFDDSFATSRRRVRELCAGLESIAGITWNSSAHPSHLDAELLRLMRDAGCRSIDLGVESGSPARLARVGKRVASDQVLALVEQASELGVLPIVNLMFGWPGETEQELDQTIDFMDACARRGALFNARGTVIPLPGTVIYRQFHRQHGFTGWWLTDDEPFRAAPPGATLETVYSEDPALERNFFGLGGALVDKIRWALERKAAHTARRLGQGGVA